MKLPNSRAALECAARFSPRHSDIVWENSLSRRSNLTFENGLGRQGDLAVLDSVQPLDHRKKSSC